VKRNLLVAGVLALVCLATGVGDVAAYGLLSPFSRHSLWHPHNRYVTQITVRPYNAFTPIAWGNLVCDGCVPNPCGVSAGVLPMSFGVPPFAANGMMPAPMCGGDACCAGDMHHGPIMNALPYGLPPGPHVPMPYGPMPHGPMPYGPMPHGPAPQMPPIVAHPAPHAYAFTPMPQPHAAPYAMPYHQPQPHVMMQPPPQMMMQPQPHYAPPIPGVPHLPGVPGVPNVPMVPQPHYAPAPQPYYGPMPQPQYAPAPQPHYGPMPQPNGGPALQPYYGPPPQPSSNGQISSHYPYQGGVTQANYPFTPSQQGWLQGVPYYWYGGR
jgi:hypothetical protein